MNEVEYAKRMAEIEEVEKKKEDKKEKKEVKLEELERIPRGPEAQRVDPDEIDDLIRKVEEIKKPHEMEDAEDREIKQNKDIENESQKLKKMVGLREFMKTEEFLRLGTKARIPVAIDLNGYEVKVFVRALSRNEIQACRVQAQNTDEDMDFLAVLKACTDENGEPFDRETLDQLGYARIRDISEAIGIASGENPANTESAIRKKVIDNFLQKIENEA